MIVKVPREYPSTQRPDNSSSTVFSLSLSLYCTILYYTIIYNIGTHMPGQYFVMVRKVVRGGGRVTYFCSSIACARIVAHGQILEFKVSIGPY